ncbi:MAG: pitrilysin family protein [Pseudomonadota bacterium]|nr:pitrilysin family protein [Pseudomonadota bacterium]
MSYFSDLSARTALSRTLLLISTIPLLHACAVNASPAANTVQPLTLSLQANTTPSVVETLPNGLKVIIRPDHRAPVVMTQVWYRVGSVDEPIDQTGLSHALEHMMFKGTPTVPNDEFSRIVAKFGGSQNAFTSNQFTGYYQLYPANRLSLALELEADRMKNLVLTEQDFVPEMRVVMEERRQRTDDNPQALAYERFRMLAFPTSPTRYPVIGHMDSLERMPLDALKQWYQTWYHPNNAVLVIVGDVQPAQALAEVQRYFAKIPAGQLPPRPAVTERQNFGRRHLQIELPIQVPSLYMAFNVPSLASQPDQASDAYALALLQAVLDGGLSARLEQRLVREQRLLAAVSSGYNLFDRGSSLFAINAIPESNHSLEAIQTALLAEIERLKTDPITDEELARVKTSYIADLIYNQDSVSGQARLIGSLEVAGLDHRLLDQLTTEFDRISVAQLQAVAQRYLVADNLSTMHLHPRPTPTAATPAETQP